MVWYLTGLVTHNFPGIVVIQSYPSVNVLELYKISIFFLVMGVLCHEFYFQFFFSYVKKLPHCGIISLDRVISVVMPSLFWLTEFNLKIGVRKSFFLCDASHVFCHRGKKSNHCNSTLRDTSQLLSWWTMAIFFSISGI